MSEDSGRVFGIDVANEVGELFCRQKLKRVIKKKKKQFHMLKSVELQEDKSS